jgi:hypothetical protein
MEPALKFYKQMPKVKQDFQFKARDLNPEYSRGLRTVPLRSCLKRNNAVFFSSNSQVLEPVIEVKTQPKWLTSLGYNEIDTDTGEVQEKTYISDDFKAGNRRKIKALDAFAGLYQPLFRSRKVTLLFHTFTQANQANMTFRSMLTDNVKRHYEKVMGLPVLGFIWTMEISERLHVHYHLCVAVPRFSIKGGQIPDELKFEKLWGRRTGVEFVKKNIRHYLAKYFAKNNSRAIGMRSYGKSKRFTTPELN